MNLGAQNTVNSSAITCVFGAIQNFTPCGAPSIAGLDSRRPFLPQPIGYILRIEPN